MMTPSEIEVLLHCYYSPEQHPRISAPAIKDAIKKFVSDGLIMGVGDGMTWDGMSYRVTPRGAAHVQQLCMLPLPEAAWVGVNGQIIPDSW